MQEIIAIGIDLAKSVFQVHAVGSDGKAVVRRQLRRNQMLEFFAKLTPCLIGIEACAGSHYWARELTGQGHDVRLMPPSYVKPYVKRGKTDAIDAEAICEAVTRPNMRFVPIKTEAQQAVLMTHRTRDFLVRQQTQISNAIRAHLGEFGIVTAKGVHNVGRLLTLSEEAALPEGARQSIRLLADQFRDTHDRIDAITAEIKAEAQEDTVATRLQTVPGIGPITASAIAASVPDVSNFKVARDLAAWIGLTPKPHSSGGKEKLGKITKMGNRYIRRLLYLGALAQITARSRKPAGEDWLWKMLQRKPVKLVAIALAGRTARTVWALLKTGESYRVIPGSDRNSARSGSTEVVRCKVK
jgi:transposase